MTEEQIQNERFVYRVIHEYLAQKLIDVTVVLRNSLQERIEFLYEDSDLVNTGLDVFNQI